MKEEVETVDDISIPLIVVVAILAVISFSITTFILVIYSKYSKEASYLFKQLLVISILSTLVSINGALCWTKLMYTEGSKGYYYDYKPNAMKYPQAIIKCYTDFAVPIWILFLVFSYWRELKLFNRTRKSKKVNFTGISIILIIIPLILLAIKIPTYELSGIATSACYLYPKKSYGKIVFYILFVLDTLISLLNLLFSLLIFIHLIRLETDGKDINAQIKSLGYKFLIYPIFHIVYFIINTIIIWVGIKYISNYDETQHKLDENSYKVLTDISIFAQILACLQGIIFPIILGVSEGVFKIAWGMMNNKLDKQVEKQDTGSFVIDEELFRNNNEGANEDLN